jgi:hypothetical protein
MVAGNSCKLVSFVYSLDDAWFDKLPFSLMLASSQRTCFHFPFGKSDPSLSIFACATADLLHAADPMSSVRLGQP